MRFALASGEAVSAPSPRALQPAGSARSGPGTRRPSCNFRSPTVSHGGLNFSIRALLEARKTASFQPSPVPINSVEPDGFAQSSVLMLDAAMDRRLIGLSW